MSKTLLSIKEGICGYGDTKIVSQVNLTLSEGEFLILEGENGSGKSTMIKTLLSLIPPLGGEFIWHIPQSRVGYVPQDLELDLSAPASALDVVETAFLFRHKDNRAKATNSLQLVGLDGKELQRFGTLSGGQRRRVLFARALASEPSCFILDEPTVNMDKETEAELGNLLHALVYKEQRSVIATSHVTAWLQHSHHCEIREGVFYG